MVVKGKGQKSEKKKGEHGKQQRRSLRNQHNTKKVMDREQRVLGIQAPARGREAVMFNGAQKTVEAQPSAPKMVDACRGVQGLLQRGLAPRFTTQLEGG